MTFRALTDDDRRQLPPETYWEYIGEFGAEIDKMSEHELEDARYVEDERDRWEDRARMIDEARDAEGEDDQ
jgi:hypothetical protein